MLDRAHWPSNCASHTGAFYSPKRGTRIPTRLILAVELGGCSSRLGGSAFCCVDKKITSSQYQCDGININYQTHMCIIYAHYTLFLLYVNFCSRPHVYYQSASCHSELLLLQFLLVLPGALSDVMRLLCSCGSHASSPCALVQKVVRWSKYFFLHHCLNTSKFLFPV